MTRIPALPCGSIRHTPRRCLPRPAAALSRASPPLSHAPLSNTALLTGVLLLVLWLPVTFVPMVALIQVLLMLSTANKLKEVIDELRTRNSQ